MTAAELIANLRAINATELREVFLYMAAHAHEARLADGQRLVDQTDFTTWLLELHEAAKPPKLGAQSVRIDLTCPRCGHIHEGDKECGVIVPGAGVCRCELQVPA